MGNWKKIILNDTSADLKSLYVSGGAFSGESIPSDLVKGLEVNSNQIDFKNLPTSDTGVPGRLYIGAGYIKISL